MSPYTKRSRPRSRTVKLTRARLRAGYVASPTDIDRPRTRGECVDGPRPCPWVGCVHHLYLDVTDAGSIKLNFPDLEPDELAVSCALDVADLGPQVLDVVGGVMNLTRERVRQIAADARRELRATVARRMR